MAYEDLIARMSLEEKCALLSGGTAFGTRPNPGKGIPELHFSDGPHGMRVQGEGANHLGIGGSLPATCFPTAVTVANTWSPELAEELGRALGDEAAAMGVSVVLGPGLCIKRDPLCGRNFEYFSEDPYLAGKMAAGYVRGIQANGLSACPKHFAVNQQETRRQASDSVLDERTLRELYLTGFEIVVEESHPQCLMTSYNLVNGTYANENEHLLKDILHAEWGYEGAMVTDWGGSNDHAAGVRAGSTFEMPAPGLTSVQDLIDAVHAGSVSETDVDARVEEALTLIFGTHEAVKAAETRNGSFDVEAHHAVARKVAAQGVVLLKNEGERPLLPLAPGARVALIGDFAKNPRYQGAGSSLVNCTRLTSLYDAAVASPDVDLVGYEQGFERDGSANEGMAAAAVELAQRADVALLCLGLSEVQESEGAERMRMTLEDNQVELLRRVRAANPNVVVLLFCGSSIETPWVADARSILYCALGGQAGGEATLDVLTGRVNPAGKLAETWPVSYQDVPTAGHFPSESLTSEYREGVYVGYRYFATADKDVAFPFGFGLSYTSFAYADVEATPEAVSFTLTNTGRVAGTEIAQVYVAKPRREVFRPEEELKGFARVTLEPGESRRVTVPLDDKAFRYFNVATDAWEVEGGTYELRVGASAADVRLTAEVNLAGTGAPNPYAGRQLAAYETGHVTNVPDAEFAALLGRAIPSSKVEIGREMCFRDMNHGRSPVFWVVWLVLRLVVNAGYKKGKPDLNALFIYNMPLRALAKNAGAIVSMGMVDALVREVKWWGLAGLVPALAVKLATGEGLILTWFVWFAVPILFELVKNLIRSGSLGGRLAKLEANE